MFNVNLIHGLSKMLMAGLIDSFATARHGDYNLRVRQKANRS